MNNKFKIGDFAFHRPTYRVFRITGFDKDHDPHARFFNGGTDTFWSCDVRLATKEELTWYVEKEQAFLNKNNKNKW